MAVDVANKEAENEPPLNSPNCDESSSLATENEDNKLNQPEESQEPREDPISGKLDFLLVFFFASPYATFVPS